MDDESFTSKWCNTIYDGLTIFISVADVSTDIIVLISYYNDDRMVFFWLSSTILLLSQIGYIVLFIISFTVGDLLDNIGRFLSFITCGCFVCKKTIIPCCSSIVDAVDPLFDKCFGLEMTFILFGYFMICIIGLIIFIMALPFGHLVGFLMYFAASKDETDDSKLSTISIWLRDNIGITKSEFKKIPIGDKILSDRAKFAIQKLNKHGGFILEAFLEALPQSILQLVSMVVYEETSSIAVISILLSMTSIMTKTLIISRGIDWKSYIFGWLCVCSDFFNIFFLVSWIFLKNDNIPTNDFLGYFNVIAEIWCWKIIIAILPPFGAAIVGYLLVGMWYALYQTFKTVTGDNPNWKDILLAIIVCLAGLTLGNAALAIGACIVGVVCVLIMEIACFGFIALLVDLNMTENRWEYDNYKTAQAIDIIINFISNAKKGNNDRIIRILAINYAYYTVYDADRRSKKALNRYIIHCVKENKLCKVTYNDIAVNTKEPPKVTRVRKKKEKELELQIANNNNNNNNTNNRNTNDNRRNNNNNNNGNNNGSGDNNNGKISCYECCTKCCGDFVGKKDASEVNAGDMAACFTAYTSLLIFIPLYFFSRILSVLYPYIILGYVLVNGLLFKLNLFELVMLGVSILLQISLCILGYFVCRTHFWLSYIAPDEKKNQMKWKNMNIEKFSEKYEKFYQAIQWIHLIEPVVIAKFGKDIGQVVMYYVIEMNKMDMDVKQFF